MRLFKAGVPQRTTCVFLYPLDRVSWAFRRVLPVLLVPADAGQHRCPWWWSTYLVLSLVSAVGARAWPLSPIAGRGRCEIKAGLEAFLRGVAQPRNRYKPGCKARRREFAQVLR